MAFSTEFGSSLLKSVLSVSKLGDLENQSAGAGNMSYFPSNLIDEKYYVAFRIAKGTVQLKEGTASSSAPPRLQALSKGVSAVRNAISESPLGGSGGLGSLFGGAIGSAVNQAQSAVSSQIGSTATSFIENKLGSAASSFLDSQLGSTASSFLGGSGSAGSSGGGSGQVKFIRDEIPQEETQYTIILPMPANIATGYAAQYTESALGPAGMMGARLGQAISENGAEGLGRQLGLEVDSASKEDLISAAKNMASAATPEIAGILGGVFGGTAGAVLSGLGAAGIQGGIAGAGMARNPGLGVLFEGIGFRTHAFEYKFIPKSRKESDTLREIIRRFKFHMSPAYTDSKQFFEYPEQFDIEFSNKDYLFDIGASVLKSFNVNYTAEGSSYFFDETGAPVSVNISMEFQEITVNTKDRIQDKNR